MASRFIIIVLSLLLRWCQSADCPAGHSCPEVSAVKATKTELTGNFTVVDIIAAAIVVLLLISTIFNLIVKCKRKLAKKIASSPITSKRRGVSSVSCVPVTARDLRHIPPPPPAPLLRESGQNTSRNFPIGHLAAIRQRNAGQNGPANIKNNPPQVTRPAAKTDIPAVPANVRNNIPRVSLQEDLTDASGIPGFVEDESFFQWARRQQLTAENIPANVKGNRPQEAPTNIPAVPANVRNNIPRVSLQEDLTDGFFNNDESETLPKSQQQPAAQGIPGIVENESFFEWARRQQIGIESKH